MSTIVVVKKAGVIVIAADTMTKYGGRYESAEHIASHSKITQVGENYFGHVGHASFGLVLQSYFSRFKTPPKLTNVHDVFEMARKLQIALKDEYFLNPMEDDDDPFESLQAQCLIATPHGIFGLYALRSVQEYTRYYAFGSGLEYAMGAMHALYDTELDAEQIARKAIEAAAKFDDGTGLPLELMKIAEKRTKSKSSQG